MIKLIIGLGNPGMEYADTRHNAGFIFLDKLAKKFGFSDFRLEKKFNAELADGKIGKTKIMLAKPQTFMNKSGEAAGALARFYKIGPKDIAVAHDDKDILFGKFKIQRNRSSAGHKGVESVIRFLKTGDFTRIRVGTALPNRKKMGDTANFVLKKFSTDELKILNKTIKEIMDRLEQDAL